METEKHQAGKHNQQSHAGKGGSGDYDPAGLFKTGKRTINIDEGNNTEKRIKQILGKDMTPERIADLVAAPDGSTVTVTSGNSDYGTALFIDVEHPLYAHPQMRAVIKTPKGDKIMINEQFELNGDAPKGVGTTVFHKQVKALREEGFKEIRTTAAKSDYYVGYKVWPKMGYDADIPDEVRSNMASWMPGSVFNANRVSDLMMTKDGRDFWESYGIGLDMTFDLSKGSLSNTVLDAYMATKVSK